jgi:hypothetical protein
MSKKLIHNSYRFEPPKAAMVDEEQIQEWITDVERQLIDKKEKYAFTRSGRALVVGMKSGKEYYIFVVRDGYEEIVITKTKK